MGNEGFGDPEIAHTDQLVGNNVGAGAAEHSDAALIEVYEVS
jgi:hypothetical protein